jgi:hypothetical protein
VTRTPGKLDSRCARAKRIRRSKKADDLRESQIEGAWARATGAKSPSTQTARRLVEPAYVR